MDVVARERHLLCARMCGWDARVYEHTEGRRGVRRAPYSLLLLCDLVRRSCFVSHEPVANDCAIKQQLLPAHLQTKPEEDVPYLSDLLEEVEQEFKDRESFRF